MNIGEFWRRIMHVVRRNRVADELAEEMRLHLDLRAAALRKAGLGDANAAAAARRSFGNRTSLLIASRDAWDLVSIEAVVGDACHVLRSLRRSPLFTVSVALTLALGIGANTALFSILDRFFFQAPGGVNDGGQTRRVVLHAATGPRAGREAATAFNYPEYRDLAAALAPDLRTTAYSTDPAVRLGTDRHGSSGVVSYIIGDFFGVLGVRPATGRVLQGDECSTRVLSPVAVISYAFWRNNFALSPDAVGRQIEIGSHRYTVVGVASREFRGVDLSAVDVWVPRNTLGSWDDWTPDRVETGMMVNLQILVRSPPSAGAIAAGENAASLAFRRGGWTADSTAMATFESLRTAVNVGAQGAEANMSIRLAGVAWLILLITCANVANLLLVRTMQRQREIATRIALGVSRSRLMLQSMIESVILAVIGGVAALICAAWLTPVLSRALLPQAQWRPDGVHLTTIAFAALLIVVTGLATGVAPALQAGRLDLYRALHGNPGGPPSYRAGIRPVLLAVQVSLSVVLLAACALVVRSLQDVEAIDTGYEAERLAYAEVLPDMSFSKRDAAAYRAVGAMLPLAAQRIAGLPDVEGAALTDRIPLRGFSIMPVFLPDRDSIPKLNRNPPMAHVVSGDFFRVAGMRILEGRPLRGADGTGSAPVVVVNSSMARTFWPGQRAVGKCIVVATRDSACRTVVGVASDAHYFGVFEQPAMQFYMTFAQADTASQPGNIYPGAILIRGRPGRLASAVAEVRAVFDPMSEGLGASRVQSMDDELAPIQHPWQLAAELLTGAALLGLLVAAVGIYGTVAYSVALRRHEIGVRLALGAQRSAILGRVLVSGLSAVGFGVIAGLSLVLALGRLFAALLYGMSARDPMTLAAVPIAILVVAVAACAVPAWRASRIDPVTLLRSE